MRTRLQILVHRPFMQGFLGVLAAAALLVAVWQAYGWARWHVYGRNNQRIDAMQDKVDRMWNYLTAQEAVKHTTGGQ
jgi:hypothetical protein